MGGVMKKDVKIKQVIKNNSVMMALNHNGKVFIKGIEGVTKHNLQMLCDTGKRTLDKRGNVIKIDE